MAKEIWYRCENCGALNSHKNSYNDKYCYDCIDIDTGEIKKEAPKKAIKQDNLKTNTPMSIGGRIIWKTVIVT